MVDLKKGLGLFFFILSPSLINKVLGSTPSLLFFSVNKNQFLAHSSPRSPLHCQHHYYLLLYYPLLTIISNCLSNYNQVYISFFVFIYLQRIFINMLIELALKSTKEKQKFQWLTYRKHSLLHYVLSDASCSQLSFPMPFVSKFYIEFLQNMASCSLA